MTDIQLGLADIDRASTKDRLAMDRKSSAIGLYQDKKMSIYKM